MKSHPLGISITALFGLLACYPLFHPGLYTAHDIWHQVARLYHYSAAIQDGQILPMWISTLAEGYGYPLFIFSYHLPWLIAIPILGAGFDIFITLKILFGLSMILSGLSMYYFTWLMTKSKTGSVAAAVIYQWAPYHFLSIYVSASIGNAWAFAILPILFAGLFQLIKKKYRAACLLITISIASLILNHLMTMMMVLPMAGAWVAIIWISQSQKNLKQIAVGATSVGLALLLTAGYLMPLFHYLPYIQATENGSGIKGLYQANLVWPSQLLYSRWGFGPVVEDVKFGEISFQIGIAQWLAIGVLGILWLLQSVVKKEWRADWLATGTVFMLSAAMMTEYSRPFWKFLDEFVSVDYPFRLLLVTVLLGSLAAGQVAAWLPKKWQRLVWLLLIVAVGWYTNRNHVRVNQYTQIPLEIYITAERTTNTFNEYMPKGYGLPQKLDSNPVAFTPTFSTSQLIERDLSAQPKIVAIPVDKFQQTTEELSIQLTLATPSAVAIRQMVFPDITVYLNGQQTSNFSKDNQGVIFLDLPTGNHDIKIKFVRNKLVKVSYAISVTSLLLFLVMIKWLDKEKYDQKT